MKIWKLIDYLFVLGCTCPPYTLPSESYTWLNGETTIVFHHMPDCPFMKDTGNLKLAKQVLHELAGRHHVCDLHYERIPATT